MVFLKFTNLFVKKGFWIECDKLRRGNLQYFQSPQLVHRYPLSKGAYVAFFN